MTGFDPFAAAAAGNDATDPWDLLADLSRRSAGTSLDRALDELGELVDRIDAEERAEGTDGAPAEVVPVLEVLTGADDAPLTYRSLHRRVREGYTSWDAFWRAPHQEADGLRLLQDVMRVGREGIADGIARLPEE
ncbi:hypothetical protein [Nocardioides campestrisoli]|uniref:hypothetical protein n=1 Tax=Nocardioides campestrisoli TaxID=2736757 RepID=UPI00163DAB02|nr:hypothetical protein [Nocardioides campestrisoli]